MQCTVISNKNEFGTPKSTNNSVKVLSFNNHPQNVLIKNM